MLLSLYLTRTTDGLSYERTVDRKLYEHSKYLSHNKSEAEEAWSSILPGHGVVLLDADYVSQKHLPPSVATSNNSNSYLYAIEAYHAMHCLVSYHSLSKGAKLQYN
jgi:hypothetical protein